MRPLKLERKRLTPSLHSATLSESRLRALSILHPVIPLAPAIFAHYMWPVSPSWTRESRPGRGVRLKAVTFLAGLERDGFARRCTDEGIAGFVLTSGGEQAVDAATNGVIAPATSADHSVARSTSPGR